MKLPSLRSSCLLLLASLLFGSCLPSADPLDWKIDARTPADFNAWQVDSVPQMPYELQDEFARAVRELILASGRAGYARSMADANDPLCRRINGKTVRWALLEAYNLEMERLHRLVAQDSALLLHSLQESEKETDPQRAQNIATMTEKRKQEIEQAKQRISVVDARLAELRSRPN